MLRKFVIAVSLVFCGLLCVGAGFFVGNVTGTTQGYHNRYLEEYGILSTILASDDAYSRIKIEENSLGTAFFLGVVSNQDDYERLRKQVYRAMGEVRGKDLMHGVAVVN